MRPSEDVVLTRDCDAALVPWGTPVRLNQGDLVTITQHLGGSFTVIANGSMYRIEGRDADALGKEPDVNPALAGLSADTITREQVESAAWSQMATCYDPEIPINVVDLGLIYDCYAKPAEGGKGFVVHVNMTLTAVGCGMGETLTQEVAEKIRAVPGVEDVQIELVWDPPWSRDRMSEAARLETGLF